MHYSTSDRSNNALANAASGASFCAASFSADERACACADMFNMPFENGFIISDTFGLSVFFVVILLAAADVINISLIGMVLVSVIISVIINVIINVIITCCKQNTAELEFGTSIC